MTTCRRIGSWVLLVGLGLLAMQFSSLASPEKAKWKREILLAANDTIYAALVYSWDQPGTYYQSSDTVAFTLRRNVDGSLVVHQPLWHNVHRMNMKTNVWTTERHTIAPLELNDTFIRYSLVAVPPYSRPLVQWGIDKQGIYLMAKNQRDKSVSLREDVLSMKDILTARPELSNPDITDPLRIAGVYAFNERIFYVVLSAGEPADVSCYEEILILDRERVRAAEAKISEQIWK